MSTWILILWILGDYGKAVNSIEFESKESCEMALIRAKNQTKWYLNSIDGICVENKQ